MTSSEHYAQFQAYNKAFFLALNSDPVVAGQLRRLAHESFQAHSKALAEEQNLPYLPDQQAHNYHAVLVVEAASETIAA